MATTDPGNANLATTVAPGGVPTAPTHIDSSVPLPDSQTTPSEQRNHWDVCLDYAQRHMKQDVDDRKEKISNLLFTAGVIAAAVGPFALDSYRNVKQDPADTTVLLLKSLVALQLNATVPQPNLVIDPDPQSPISAAARRINGYFFVSLTLSLVAVVLGIVVSQWIQEYDREPRAFPASREEQLGVCQMRCDDLKRSTVFGYALQVSSVLLLSLLLFFAGIIELLWENDKKTALVVLVLVSIVTCMLVMTTMHPTLVIFTARFSPRLTRFFSPLTPYKSLQAWISYRFLASWVEIIIRLPAIQTWIQYDLYVYRNVFRSAAFRTAEGFMGFNMVSPVHWLGSMYLHDANFADALYNCLVESARWNHEYSRSLHFSLSSQEPRLSRPLQRAMEWSSSQSVAVKGVDNHVSDVAVFQALAYLVGRTEKGQPSTVLLRPRLELFIKIQTTRLDPDIDCPLLTTKDLEKLIPTEVWRDALRSILDLMRSHDANKSHLTAISRILEVESKTIDFDIRLFDAAMEAVTGQITRQFSTRRDERGARGSRLLQMEQQLEQQLEQTQNTIDELRPTTRTLNQSGSLGGE